MGEKAQLPKIKHVLCPSDLTERSQAVVGFGARVAEKVGAKFTACHCVPAAWFSTENRLTDEQARAMTDSMTSAISAGVGIETSVDWRCSIIENSFNPANDILETAKATGVDLIVLKARPGFISAFRFGSIVERIVSSAECPVMLVPSKVLPELEGGRSGREFGKILFDYNIWDTTSKLFHFASSLAESYGSDLHMLSVQEKPSRSAPEIAPTGFSGGVLAEITRKRIEDVLKAEGRTSDEVSTTIASGQHAEAVLRYAETENIDLICTVLPPPHYLLERIYSAYLGSLLNSAHCPILAEQIG